MKKTKRLTNDEPLRLGGKTFEEWEAWRGVASNPSHPDHEKWKISDQELQEVFARTFPSILAASAVYEQADEAADQLIYLAKRSEIETFVDLFPDQGLGLIVLSLIAKHSKQVRLRIEEAQKIVSERQSEIASNPKADTLQNLIVNIVRDNLHISESELRVKINAHQEIEPIQEIDGDKIYFTNSAGKTKEAKISGLKDRLSRAKKTIRTMEEKNNKKSDSR